MDMVPSSRIVRFISAFMSAPLSQNELVFGLHGLLPAQLESDVADNFLAVLHAQLVNSGDVGLVARRLALFQGGDQIAASVHQFAAFAKGADLQSEGSGGFL